MPMGREGEEIVQGERDLVAVDSTSFMPDMVGRNPCQHSGGREKMYTSINFAQKVLFFPVQYGRMGSETVKGDLGETGRGAG